MASRPTIVLIAGPTGVGKTSLSLQLAEHFGTAIISADSRQCYKELNIGVARPSPEELQRVRHYFIATHSITETVNAGTFARYAQDAANEVFAQNDIVFLVGGTGLYIKAFTEGIDEMPPIPEGIRRNVREGYKDGGLEWLQAELRKKDPLWFSGGEIQNPHRLMRALEVVEATGRSIREFQKSFAGPDGGASGADGGRSDGRPRLLKIALDLPRPLLYERIDHRVDQMMARGLLAEVEGLLPCRSEKALETVGYKELFAYLDGVIGLDEAVDGIKQHTRNYAKRQLTWFKRDSEIRWFSPEQVEPALACVQQYLSSVS